MRRITDERLARQAQSAPVVNALRIAQNYPVFPCDAQSKRPLILHGFKAATQDAAIVTRWWSRYPRALIGVPTGAASGLLAIDVDPDGQDWYRGAHGRLGVHRLHGTRRGKHLLYRMNGAAIRNSAGVVASGVDVRGEGGYIIWWPAHGGVSVGEPGDLPGWLAQAAAQGTASARKLNGHAKRTADEEVSEGGRDDYLSRKAYALVKAGWGHEKILAELKALNAYYCNPPLAHKQLERIARGKVRFVESEEESEVELLSALDVEEKRIDWLWKGFLARNKLHLLSGAGGSLKSTLTLTLATIVSTGGTWPDGTKCPRGNVIIWTGEDDLNDTVKPRLRFAGADLTRCYFVNGVQEGAKHRTFDPAFDMAKLQAACVKLKEVSLVIVDPAISVVQRDGNSAAEVRRGLDLLIALGRQQQCAVVGIHHVNKGSKGKAPGERVTGSGAWTQAPRLSLMVGAIDMGDDKVPNKWVFLCEKTQGKGRGVGYEYTFEEEPDTEVTRIAWGKRLEGSPQFILAEAEGTEAEGSKVGLAVKFLKALLADGKSMGVWEVKKQTEDAGIKPITLRRAKEELKIETLRAGKNSFRWVLPEG